MTKQKPYTTCPSCGSTLDHGERCDCAAAPSETHGRNFYASTETPEEKARRREFVFALMERQQQKRRRAK